MNDTEERPPKPHGNSFQQQKLAHYAPQHTAQGVVLCLFAVAVIFIPIGASVVVVSDGIFEEEFRYDDVKKCTHRFNDGLVSFPGPDNTSYSQGCRTRKLITLSKTLKAPVYMYYRVDGFYQNYRLFGNSKSMSQNRGDVYEKSDSYVLSCKPFRGPQDWLDEPRKSVTFGGAATTYAQQVYNPCGAVPWSMFNDSIDLFQVPAATVVDVNVVTATNGLTIVCKGDAFTAEGSVPKPFLVGTIPSTVTNGCTKKGIALSSDRDERYKTPVTTLKQWTGYGLPGSSDFFQANGYYADEVGHKLPKTVDEDFMVWMRLGATPDLRKLYRVINRDLLATTYLLDIQEFFDTVSFSGKKYVVIATSSWLGGKNHVLGILFILFGCIAFVLGVAFLAMHAATKSSRS